MDIFLLIFINNFKGDGFLKGTNVCIFKLEKNLEEIQELLENSCFKYIDELLPYDIPEHDKKLIYRWVDPDDNNFEVNSKVINGVEIRYIVAIAQLEVSLLSADKIIIPNTDMPLPKQMRVSIIDSSVIFASTTHCTYAIVSGSRSLESKIRNNLMQTNKRNDSEWGNVEFKEITEYKFDKSFYYWIIKNKGETLTLNDKSITLNEVKGFISDTERQTSKYKGQGTNIDTEIPLRSIVGMDEKLISLYINILYDNNTYSFYLDYDGRINVFQTECGEFGTQDPCPIEFDELLLNVYFDIIPFFRVKFNEAMSSNWNIDEEAFRKKTSIDIILELMRQNSVTLEDLEISLT